MTTGTAEKPEQATDKAQVVTPAPSKGLDKEKGGAEVQPEEMLPRSEVDRLLGKAGQKIQAKLEAVTAERDSYKTQAETLKAEMTEAKSKIDSLTKDIDAMSEDDPDKYKLVQRRKEWESALESLKQERAELAESRTEITQWKRDQLVYTIADEYVTATGENVDFDKFKTDADRFKLNDRENLEALAETLGYKLKGETPEQPDKPKTPAPKPFSGRSEGGSESLEGLSSKQLFQKAYSSKR